MIELKIVLDDVNYETIAEEAMPHLKKNLDKIKIGGKATALLFSMMKKVPDDQAAKLLATLPQSVKDTIAVFLVNSYKEKIADAIAEALKKKGFQVKIHDMSVRNTSDESADKEPTEV